MSYLSHFFKDTLNTTFQDFVNKQRFEYACILLRGTEKSVAEISSLSGFSDVRYLTRCFQKKYQCTPAEYRKKAKSSIPYVENHATFQRILSSGESLNILAAQYEEHRKRLFDCSIGELFQE